MSEARTAFVAFHYAEKIKTSLIVASNLLQALKSLKEEAEIAGAEKLLAAYFGAVTVEVNIAANASQIGGFRSIAVKLQEAAEKTRRHNYADAEKLVSEAITVATTHGSEAAKTLEEKSLI
ncbi:MAG: hypothetical protein QXJ94_03165 [Candidatus Bathyarchaeia archaeon]